MTPRVLIVDDSPTMRSVLKRVIELTGHPTDYIHEASDGVEAIECLQQHDIAIALIDIHMPHMSGLELLERMSQEPHHRTVLVAIVSSDAHRKELQPFVRQGVLALLRKPFRHEDVRDVFRSLVSLRERRGVL